jgi:shikimate kinase
MPSANIILIGFMGAGKSTVGRLLARRLGRCFVETDDMITGREGRSIPEIFGSDGEERFRQLEAETLDALALKSGNVIATGGGLPCRDGHMTRLRELGTVIWLKSAAGVAFDRARRSGARPMLAGRSREEVDALYRQREPYYQQAHVAMDTTGLGVDQVVGRLLSLLRTPPRRDAVGGVGPGEPAGPGSMTERSPFTMKEPPPSSDSSGARSPRR